jgi:site-specific DNA-methyltransferase (adenine-specific)/modification methylase
MLREGQERRFHPTQKPLEIMKWVLNLAPATKTSEAPTVIDPFAGSGTTGVACVAMGMRFVGIEREPRYFDTMVDRIKRAYHDTSLLTLAEA